MPTSPAIGAAYDEYAASMEARERAAIRATLRAYRDAIAAANARIEQLRAGLESHPEDHWRAYAIREREAVVRELEDLLAEAARVSAREIDLNRAAAAAEAHATTGRAVAGALAESGQDVLAGAVGGTVNRESLRAIMAQVYTNSPVAEMLQAYAKQGARRAGDRIVQAVALGENPHKIVGAIRGELGTEAWKALRIARTEVIRAHTAGAIATMRATPAVTPAYEWVAQSGSACVACLAMHGTVHSTDQPPARHPNCFPAGTIAAGPRVTGSVARWYTGDVVDVEFASGKRLTVTPNHPVLTTHGWVGAGLLDESSDVVGCRDAGRLARIVDPDDHQVPSPIEEVAVSLGGAQGVSSISVPLSPVDIHGDGAGSDVAVVRSDRLLGNTVEASLGEQSEQDALVLGVEVAALLAADGGSAERFDAAGGAASCCMCGCDIGHALGGGSLGGDEFGGLGHAADLDALGFEPGADDISGHAEALCDAVLRFAADVPDDDLGVGDGELHTASGADLGGGERFPLGWRSPEPLGLEDLAEALLGDVGVSSGVLAAVAGEIELDRVVLVTRRAFAGHVYNLETVGGWYIADNIVTHNCKCVMLPVVIDPTTGKALSQPAETGQDVIDRMPLDEAQRRFGIRRGQMLKAPDASRVRVADMVGTTTSERWGDTVRVVPLKELAS